MPVVTYMHACLDAILLTLYGVGRSLEADVGPAYLFYLILSPNYHLTHPFRPFLRRLTDVAVPLSPPPLDISSKPSSPEPAILRTTGFLYRLPSYLDAFWRAVVATTRVLGFANRLAC